MAKQKTDGGMVGQYEVRLEEFILKKLPALPANIKEFIVKFGPWLVLIGLVMGLPTLLTALGLSAVFFPAYYRYGFHYGYSFALWISIASMVLMAVALPGLFKRAMSAWRLMLYSSLVMAVYNLISVNLGGLIIGTGVSLYILFQIKSYYK